MPRLPIQSRVPKVRQKRMVKLKRVETNYIQLPGYSSVMICWGIDGIKVECVWVVRIRKPRKR